MAYGTRSFQCRIHKGSPIISILSRINPITRIIPISSRSILILSSHLRVSLPKGLFPVGLPVKILKALLPSSILATCPAHLNLLDLITLTILGERYKLLSSSLWSLLHSPFAFLLGPNIRLRMFSNIRLRMFSNIRLRMFSNILRLHSYLNLIDHASQLYSTTGNIIVLYFNFQILLYCRLGSLSIKVECSKILLLYLFESLKFISKIYLATRFVNNVNTNFMGVYSFRIF